MKHKEIAKVAKEVVPWTELAQCPVSEADAFKVVSALDALGYLKGPPNKKLQIDACECDEPEPYQETLFTCNSCGLPLRTHD